MARLEKSIHNLEIAIFNTNTQSQSQFMTEEWHHNSKRNSSILMLMSSRTSKSQSLPEVKFNKIFRRRSSQFSVSHKHQMNHLQ